MRRVLAKGLDPNKSPMSEIMTKELKLASEDDLVVDWLRGISNERFRHLPVVDENGILVNLMSQSDCVSYTWLQLLLTVKDKAKSSFMDRFYFYMIISGVMAYRMLMILVFKLIQ
jgi:signal-transduction protein with cAMP-binding, CBS, and nucleotidyltransferase domain